MAGHSEKFGEFKIEQIQVDEYVDGTYNTYVTYYGKTFKIKYHRYATEREAHEIDPADVLYNQVKGHDIISQCKYYKDLLNDIAGLKLIMTEKIKIGITYRFDMEFVNDTLKKIVNEVHNNIQEIYLNLQLEAAAKGRQFYIPLPDYTVKNVTEGYAENEQSTDIAIKDNPENDVLKIIETDVKLAIELIKELIQQKERPEIINDLINAGKLEQNMVNGKYKPLLEIKDFMLWLYNYGYEDCLNFNFFNTFIFYELTDETIKQYLKPSNFGGKKQRR